MQVAFGKGITVNRVSKVRENMAQETRARGQVARRLPSYVEAIMRVVEYRVKKRFIFERRTKLVP